MLLFAGITLPLEDPILKFLLILVIILAAPLLLNKLKIPYLLGLIIAGAVIGPHGLNLVLRDSSIILSGTAGLLYIMFLSGLDMDMSDFRKNGTRSLVFGLYTFCVPLLLGILAGYYILGFSIYSSILLAGLFASQTLIAYPIVSKLGIARIAATTSPNTFSCWSWSFWAPTWHIWPDWSRSSAPSSRVWPSTASSRAPRP